MMRMSACAGIFDFMKKKHKILILGAAGRDFHNFNVVYRNDSTTEVAAFTATQIPGIDDRRYPANLAGRFYPKGIPIEGEDELEELIIKNKIDECVLSYSDLSYATVMHLASRVIAAGAKFSMLGAEQTMIKSKKPVIAVVAVRTGCGKSPTTRCLVEVLRAARKRVVVVRHPMPYGNLESQEAQCFRQLSDLEKFNCSIEEIEEYEPHIERGSVVCAGVDYQKILKLAEKEADVIIWDGGNNDTSFFKPTITITVADPHRAGHEIGYYPGEINFRLADLILITKVNSASPEQIKTVVENAKQYNPRAEILKSESVFIVEAPEKIKGKRVLVIEDGPTITHGEMKSGAGFIVAKQNKAAEIIDPRSYAVGALKGVFKKYPHIGNVLPAMGYGEEQIKDLKETINRARCDMVIVGTPVNLSRIIKINKPTVRVRYELSLVAKKAIGSFLRKKGLI